jgi:hypothetical protein
VRPAQVWRVLPAAVLAVPLAVALRALLLNTAAQPIFALVLTAFAALGVGLWRLIYAGAAAGLPAKGGRHG